MTDPQLRKLYTEACHTKGFEPSDGQFKTWKATLGWIEEQDLSKALFYWFGNQTTFPMPAELKPLAARSKRERESRKDLVLVTSVCALCHRMFTGFHAADDDTQRYCYGPDPQERRDHNNKVMICGGNLVRQ
jgi:hypothetical protein